MSRPKPHWESLGSDGCGQTKLSSMPDLGKNCNRFIYLNKSHDIAEAYQNNAVIKLKAVQWNIIVCDFLVVCKAEIWQSKYTWYTLSIHHAVPVADYRKNPA